MSAQVLLRHLVAIPDEVQAGDFVLGQVPRRPVRGCWTVSCSTRPAACCFRLAVSSSAVPMEAMPATRRADYALLQLSEALLGVPRPDLGSRRNRPAPASLSFPPSCSAPASSC